MKFEYNPTYLFFQIFDIHQCEICQLRTAKTFGVFVANLGPETGF
jgi:hypothetical protein